MRKCWYGINRSLLYLCLFIAASPIIASDKLFTYPRLIPIEAENQSFLKSNWMISQSLDREIFLANSMGFIAYDGSTWQLNSMPNNKMLRAIYAADDDRIYVGSFGEFGYWKKTTNLEFQYHSLSEKLYPNSAQNEEIWNIISRNSSVLFQSFGKIYEYDQSSVQEIIPPFSISLISKVYDRLILQVNGQGLMELMPNNTFKLISGHPYFLNHSLKFVLPFKKDELLIGTTDGLVVFNGQSIRPWNVSTTQIFNTDQLNKAIELENGKYGFGTIANGFFITDRDGKIEAHLNKSTGLKSNNVLSLLEDQDHNIWVSSNLGLDLIEMNSSLIHFTDYSGKYGAAFTGKIFNDYFYLGTNQGLFVSPWHESMPLNLQLIPGSKGLVWELEVFDNTLLCGHNRGTLVIHDTTAHMISDISGGRAFTSIPGHDHLLLQGSYGGLVLLENEAGQWKLKHPIQGINTVINAIEVGTEETFWIANPYQGLYKIKLDASFESIREIQAYGPAKGLPSIYQIELMKINGAIKVLSNNQLYNYNTALDIFEQDTSTLAGSVFIGQPIQSLNDSLYVLFDKQSGKLFNRGHLLNQSLLLHEISDPNLSDLGRQMILVNRANEFAVWNYGVQDQNFSKDVPTIIHSICYSKNSLLELSCLEADEGDHKIAAKSRYIVRFQFSIPLYNLQPKYRYKLEGFDQQWSNWSASGIKEYANLSKGKYAFLVENDVNNQMASFQFEILPFWYQSRIAYGFYFLTLLTVSFIVRKFYATKLKNELRRMDIQKQRELQRQKLTLQNQQLLADVEGKKIELANYAGSLVRKNDVLQKLKFELQGSNGAQNSKLSNKLHRIIDQHLSSEQDWEKFESSFNEIHDEFFKRLKQDFPELKPGDMKLAAYLKMNLSSKEIASLMNITLRGVENKRYRLRKKMQMSPDDNLTDTLLTY